MSFVKLKRLFDTIPYTPVPGFESFAGKYGLGVQHNNIWSPESEKLLSVIPERFRHDFQLTRMSINSMLLPHIDNDFITTINFYFQPGEYRTMFYEPKPGARSWQTEEKQSVYLGEMKEPDISIEDLKNDIKDFVSEKQNMPTIEEITYVDAVYNFDEVYETGSFIAQPFEAYMLDVRKVHTVEPLNGPKLRKAFALRARTYDYGQVYEMLQETGNL